MIQYVTSREGRVSRNEEGQYLLIDSRVTSREGRVSRNSYVFTGGGVRRCHVPRGTCE